MSFFSSGEVSTRDIDRSKLSDGTYRIRLADFADHIGAAKGSRTQIDFIVVDGPSRVGGRAGHIVPHTGYTAEWQTKKARGEIATGLAAFMGLSAEAAERKITPEVFAENSRTVQYANGGNNVASVTREASELPLVAAGAEAILVVLPYFDKTGKRKHNPKTGAPSVIYKFMPLNCGLQPTSAVAEVEAPADEAEDDLPPAPAVDPLELALADGWRANGPTYFYKKGEPAQLKADALRAKYGA